MFIRLIFIITLSNMLWISDSATASEVVDYVRFPLDAKFIWRSDEVPPSLCKLKDEFISFSCPLYNGKTLSVCVSRNLSPSNGYIVYRYGLPGHVEFDYSAQRNEPAPSFYYSGTNAQTENQASLSFHQADYKYTVFYHRFDKGDQSISRSGVSVSKKRRVVFQKLCENGGFYTTSRTPRNNKGEPETKYGLVFSFNYPPGLNLPADNFTDRIFAGEDVK